MVCTWLEALVRHLLTTVFHCLSEITNVFSPAKHPVWILKVTKVFVLFLERSWKKYRLKVSCALGNSQWMGIRGSLCMISVQLQESWWNIMCPSYFCPISPSSGTQRQLKHKWIAPFMRRNVTHRGSWGKGEWNWHVFTTNQTVDRRIKTHSYCYDRTVAFPLYNCWQNPSFLLS